MIFHYDGKSYDTADGQEQPHAESARKPAETGGHLRTTANPISGGIIFRRRSFAG